MTTSTTKNRFIRAFVDISTARHSFGKAVTLAVTKDKLEPKEAAAIAAEAATEYFRKVVRPVVEDLNHSDKLPSALTSVPEYKAALDAIAHGSRILARETGYKINGNASRVSLADYVAGTDKAFTAEEYNAKAPKQTTAKARQSATKTGPQVPAPMPTENRAAVLEQLGWKGLVTEAIKQAKSKGQLAELAAMVAREFKAADVAPEPKAKGKAASKAPAKGKAA